MPVYQQNLYQPKLITEFITGGLARFDKNSCFSRLAGSSFGRFKARHFIIFSLRIQLGMEASKNLKIIQE